MAIPLPSTQNPVGFFTPPSQLGSPSPLLADNIDMATRDFASLFIGDDPTDAAVKVALGTVRGSGPAVVDVGMPPEPRKMDEAHTSVIQSNAKLALKLLIQNGDIELLGVSFDTVDEANQFTQARVEYRNLRALDSTTRTVPLGYPATQ